MLSNDSYPEIPSKMQVMFGSASRTLFVNWATLLIVAVAGGLLAGYLYDRGPGRQVPFDIVIKEWEEHNGYGIRLGPDEAPFVITEFMDFTCPYCRLLVPTLDSLLQANPTTVAVVFMHFPLTNPISMDLAVAAECAYEQGIFWPMYRTIYNRHDVRSSNYMRDLAGLVQMPDMDSSVRL